MNIIKKLWIKILFIITLFAPPAMLFGMKPPVKNQQKLNYLLDISIDAKANRTIIERIKQGATCNVLKLLRYAQQQHDLGDSELLDFLADRDKYPFQVALEVLDLKLIQCLLARYPELNKPILFGRHGVMALQKAIVKDNEELVGFLMREGVSILSIYFLHETERNSEEITLAHYAAFLGRTNIMKRILEHFKATSVEPSTVLDKYAHGLLHYTWHPNKRATEKNSIAITKLLVEAGCTNHLSQSQQTPMYFVCYHHEVSSPEFKELLDIMVPPITPSSPPPTRAAGIATTTAVFSPTGKDDRPLPCIASTDELHKPTPQGELSEELARTLADLKITE